ncbi:hypothetical protein [Candidatus Manganitrophus noduliformans]|uniref:Uncharacterized protein n=1 Tax=Candidatus Manganitrophus noduliformans TaxID=2606439 RepID=A0A7X6ICE5_9BACT|nr:hypothetical protein [Candidatus Manganitrophus noduliformans]NKE72471.1 hypothetical protein [Candidatus Manganitrophus noduliformans]
MVFFNQEETMNRPIKKITLFVLGIGILAFSVQGAYAQALDFFSNTQSLDKRSSGSDGAPGFNPCAGGTTQTTTECSGAPGGSEPLLDALNLGDSVANTAGLFEKTGPGAITDNMFGIVERPATPLVCGAQGAGVLAGGVGSLNCGDGKFDPSTQDQTIPTSGTNLTGAMAVNTPIDMTSCGAGSTMGACANDAALHRSQVEDAFVWNPTGSTVNLPVNTANMPTIIAAPAAKTCAAGSAANPAVCGQASMIETTALGTTTTVVVSLATDWATTNSAAGAMGTAPTVNWESKIVQSEMIGGGTFDQTLSGSFTYNGSAFTATQYPSGQSFTIRAGGGGTPVESIP